MKLFLVIFATNFHLFSTKVVNNTHARNPDMHAALVTHISSTDHALPQDSADLDISFPP